MKNYVKPEVEVMSFLADENIMVTPLDLSRGDLTPGYIER